MADARGATTSRRERWCFALSFVCALGVGVVYVLAVRTVRGQALEITAMNGRAVQPRRLASAAEVLLDTVSIASLAGLMVAALGIALVRRNLRLAWVVALIVVGSTMTTEALKRKVFTRPPLSLGYDGGAPFNTLPSGHTTVAMCLIVAGVLVVPRRLQGIVALLGAPYAIGIGVATVLAGWHRPSDVVAACLVVGAWTFAGLLLLDWVGAMRSDARQPWERYIAPGIVVGLVVTIGALAATSVYGLRFHYARVSDVGRRGALKPALAFAFSAASIATVATMVIGAVLWVLRDVHLSR